MIILLSTYTWYSLYFASCFTCLYVVLQYSYEISTFSHQHIYIWIIRKFIFFYLILALEAYVAISSHDLSWIHILHTCLLMFVFMCLDLWTWCCYGYLICEGMSVLMFVLCATMFVYATCIQFRNSFYLLLFVFSACSVACCM